MKKKLLAVAFLAIFGLAGLAGLVMPEAALAETVQGKWINKGRIEIGGVPYIDSKPDDDSRDYYENGFTSDVDCKKVIRDFEGNDRAKLHKRKRLPKFGGIDCVTDSKDDVELTDQESADDAGDGDGESDDDSCETRMKSPLSWIVCPIIEGALGAAEQFDNAITNELTIKTGINPSDGENALFDEQQEPGKRYYQIWSAMRFISMGLLVIIALIMVVSQAMSIGIFDAYTVRKILPRLIAAVVFVSLSWEIGKLLIEIANAFGHGIRAIIYAPFNDVASLDNPFSLGSGGLATTVFVGGFLALGAIGLLSLALTALMAAAIGFLVIVFRKIVIILLLLMAPFAIVCAILPNTEKVWKLWWDSFGKGLMMFPIIMAFIAVGRVVAAATEMTPDGGAEGSLLQQVITFIAYFGPYFALPATFRLAGGALATIGGLSNDRSRGAFDRLKNYRKQTSARRFGEMKTGQLWQERGNMTNPLTGKTISPVGRFNKVTRGIGTGFKGNFGMGAKGAEAVDQVSRNAAFDIGNTPAGKAIQDDDYALRAATYRSYKDAVTGMQRDFDMKPEEAERAARAAATSIGFGQPQAIWAAQRLVATGTGFAATEKQTAMEQMVDTLARVSGGNESTANGLAGYANAISKQTGRFELAPGYGPLSELVRTQAGVEVDPSTKLARAPMVPGSQEYVQKFDKANVEAWKAGSTYQLAQGKPKQFEAFVKTWQRELDTALSSDLTQVPNQNKLRESITAFEEMKQILPNTSGSNADIINKALDGYNIGMGGLGRKLQPPVVEIRDAGGKPVLDATGQPTYRPVPGGEVHTYNGLDHNLYEALVDDARSRVRRYDPYEDRRRALGPQGDTPPEQQH